ncbi:3-to-5 exonuclease [Ligilactobacillus hayakitensis DSM 18933 = JCM 14209]|uniref:3-to-5 exonuclease n=1 Tax=Ligilactobacillus hayakitensis DSM 18933 = JCM 14209 TaxID=1423755 RepID=A0A0R1WUJ3_9LACO|nr:HD domain-containing protein [Ligilactobacillus hayakitensis]KRM19419.1 3-to-5 exonuclease [Ligilactobacillus hayakitensis DSM 18933 = JCM 14209]
MEEKRIFDYKVDENLEIMVLIKSAEVRVAKNGKKFIAFNFEDKSGTISAKFWDANDAIIQRFTAGKVVKLTGKREVYQGNPQIKIFRMFEVPNAPDISEFIQSAPLNVEAMENEIKDTLFEITVMPWNRITRWLLNKYHNQYFDYPAAKKNHHAFKGGLAFHSLSILRLAKAVANEYENVNKSLLYAGAILHDLGKVIELSGSIATTYTIAGNLIGHIVLLDEEIIKACQDLNLDPNDESILLLRHMILSHHGLLEYGSPVRPHILEAEILHNLDNLDASIQMINGAIDHTPQGDFSEKIFGLDGRSFYNPDKKGER